MTESTSSPIAILGIGGSTRDNSITLSVLRDILAMAEDAGAETTLIDVRDLDLPMYNEDIPLAEQSPQLHRLLAAVDRADAFVLASPTYHGTVPGALKNVLDALNSGDTPSSSTFEGRPIGLVAYGGPSSLNVVNALYHSVRGLRGIQVPTVVTVNGSQTGESGAGIADANTRKRAGTMVDELIKLASLQRGDS